MKQSRYCAAFNHPGSINIYHMSKEFKKCLVCGTQYDLSLRSGRKTQTCSKSCSTVYRNQNKVWTAASKALISAANTGRLAGSNNPNYQGGGVKFRCSYCSEEFEVSKNELNAGKRKGKFCSAACRDEERRPVRKVNIFR